MKTTQNYGLRKPEPTDFYNVDDFNFNADVIDTELFAVKQKADQTESDLSTHLNEKVTDEFGVHGLKIEEGLWTPSLIGDLVAGSHSYVTRYGFYRRVGNQVFIYFHIHLQNKDNAMDGVAVGIEGLPFVVSDVSIGASVTIGAASYIDLSPGYTQLTGEFPTLSTRLYLRQIGSGLEGIYLPPAGVKDTSILIGSGAYLIL